MATPNNPFFSSLVEAHKFATTTPALDVCVDQLSDIVEHHKYTGHPDDECNYEACMREELEIALMNATRVQEKAEELSITMMESMTWEARYQAAYTEYHKLFARYGSKSK
tara:strand:- start:128 stop:457 length:330 start_codon:yes stop_codon:yes gene_type:complete